MNLIEITCPAGVLDDQRRRTVADAVLANFLVEPDAPPQAIERAGRATHVWFRDAQTWTTGAGAYRPGAPVPFVVTVTVPRAWQQDLAKHAMAAVRVALVRHVPEAAVGGEGVWINVVGIEDGSIGMNGRPITSADIVRHLTRGIEPRADTDLPDGVLVDPVCGMTVRLGRHAITIEHDGRTIAFCATGCRDVYAQDHGLHPGETGSPAAVEA